MIHNYKQFMVHIHKHTQRQDHTHPHTCTHVCTHAHTHTPTHPSTHTPTHHTHPHTILHVQRTMWFVEHDASEKIVSRLLTNDLSPRYELFVEATVKESMLISLVSNTSRHIDIFYLCTCMNTGGLLVTVGWTSNVKYC